MGQKGSTWARTGPLQGASRRALKGPKGPYRKFPIGFFRIFVLIMLPLTKPVVATVSILQVLHAWNDFLLPVVITLGNPDIRTLSVGVYAFKGEYFIDWSGMAAASVITILPIIVLFLFMQKYFVEGVQGAVKG